MLKFVPNTPVKFYAKSSSYTTGQGPSSAWEAVVAASLFCEWKGSFGERALTAQSLGVNDSATLRMIFHPTLYEKLRSSQVIIIKNADSTGIVNGVPDKNNPNVYELWGGVDNVAEANQFLEFKVRRYEGV